MAEWYAKKKLKMKSGEGEKMERRVVITGLGAITPIGNNVRDFWKGIEDGKCGIDEITGFDTTNFKVKLAGEVKGYNPEDYFEKREAKRMDKFSQFAVISAREAWEDSKLNKDEENMERVGVIVGSGIGGLETIEKDNKRLVEKGPDRVSPMYIPMSIGNMAAGNVAIDLGAKGESISMVTACASGTHCIGESFRMIKHGYQDIIIAGGTESSITPSGIAGFTNIKALTQESDKNRASIPFDKERSGFVMGEGAGIIILEELEHAKARGAKIYAEIVGYGATSDAYHITSPAPGGEGGARAMKIAMQEAGAKPEEITYINAHGTSTHMNDSCETSAVKLAFGESAKRVMMSSTKGNTGHLLGAAGGIEAVICIKAIENEFVPPTINYKVPDEECDLDIVPNNGRNIKIEYAMSNSLGFGGHNASILLKKYYE
jgi:3-oxoacyl-[acyl-carrier-protein] synthase II